MYARKHMFDIQTEGDRAVFRKPDFERAHKKREQGWKQSRRLKYGDAQ